MHDFVCLQIHQHLEHITMLDQYLSREFRCPRTLSIHSNTESQIMIPPLHPQPPPSSRIHTSVPHLLTVGGCPCIRHHRLMRMWSRRLDKHTNVRCNLSHQTIHQRACVPLLQRESNMVLQATHDHYSHNVAWPSLW